MSFVCPPVPTDSTDIPPALARALALARQGQPLSAPNPCVGCVITDADGHVLGEGHTQRAGGPHGEIMALRDAAAKGHAVRGATAWVTLEPCAHHGRTGPCSEALVTAGIGRVVAAMTDPFAQVAGQGFAHLRAAGLDVTVLDGSAAEQQARDINPGFFSRIERGRPWVRMKMAASVDGQTALSNGQSQWITGEAARADGHAWRARAGAILTGIGTVLADDPRLDVRHGWAPRQPHLVVVDSRLELPPQARLIQTLGARGEGQSEGGREIWVYTAQDGPAGRRSELRDLGVQVLDCPGPGGKVDLAGMLQDLAHRQVNELHVEAGFKLNGSFMREGLVDEWLLYLAPRFLGPGQGLAALPALAALADLPAHQRLRFHEVCPVGEDLRLRLRAQ